MHVVLCSAVREVVPPDFFLIVGSLMAVYFALKTASHWSKWVAICLGVFFLISTLIETLYMKRIIDFDSRDFYIDFPYLVSLLVSLFGLWRYGVLRSKALADRFFVGTLFSALAFIVINFSFDAEVLHPQFYWIALFCIATGGLSIFKGARSLRMWSLAVFPLSIMFSLVFYQLID